MLVSALLLPVTFALSVPVADSTRLVADTLVIQPIGVHVTVPALWMGRVPPELTARRFGAGAPFGCQIDASHSPLENRIVVDPSRFAGIQSGLFGERKSYQDALDMVLPVGSMVAHAGGDRFNSKCLAPQVHIYVADSAAVHVGNFLAQAQATIERQYPGVRGSETDSAGWHIVRFSWTETKTDFIHPASLMILARVIGGRALALGVMDAWTDPRNVNDLLTSIRW